MKTIMTWLAVLLGSLGSLPAALNVVTTIPDFASIAEAVGGEHIKATSLARGPEDAHFVDARPTLLRALNKADVLVEGGADLEIGWLPPLVKNARNRNILPGAPGRVSASEGVPLLEVPTAPVDRSQGDVHAAGNPHFWLDPVNGKILARHLSDVFGTLDPDHAADFQANTRRFEKDLDARLAGWQVKMKPYAGTKVLTYHKSFEYFAARFGLVVAGQLEPKPGIEPTPGHVTQLIPQAKTEGVRLVLVEPFRPRRTPEYVAQSLGVPLVLLPDKVEAVREVRDYLGLFDYNVDALIAALKKDP